MGVTESGGQVISLKANLIPAWGKEQRDASPWSMGGRTFAESEFYADWMALNHSTHSLHHVPLKGSPTGINPPWESLRSTHGLIWMSPSATS